MDYTKGPWKWKICYDSGNDIEAETLRGNNDDIVISLDDDYPGYPECGQHLIMEITKADVQLIEAAPDMYEALKELMDIMQGIIAGDYKPDSFTMQPARLAIAKAEGSRD